MRHERINPLLLRRRVRGLDLVGAAAGPAGLWGTCLLNPAWTGAIARLRRSGDSAERDWRPDGSGYLPVPQIAEWLTGGSGFFVSLYDQYGLGRTATQSTAGSQPTYGTVNGKPVATGDGSRFLSVGSALGVARKVAGFTIAAAARPTTITGGYRAFANIYTGTGGARAYLATNTSNYEVGGRTLDANSYQAQTAAATTDWVRLIGRFRYSEAKLDLQVDGGALATRDPFQATGNTSDTDSSVAPRIMDGAGIGLTGNLTAMAWWPRALTAAELAAVNTALLRAIP